LVFIVIPPFAILLIVIVVKSCRFFNSRRKIFFTPMLCRYFVTVLNLFFDILTKLSGVWFLKLKKSKNFDNPLSFFDKL